MNLRIGTFNICHCGDYSKHEEGDPFELYNVNIGQTANAIKNLNCGIIGLNEVYNDGTDETIDFKNQTEKLAKLAGYKYYCYAQGHDHGWTDIGNAILSKYPIKCFKKIPIYTLKDLRHTYTSRARECGIDNELVAIWTGHSLGNITASVYTHFSMEHQQKQAKKLNYS